VRLFESFEVLSFKEHLVTSGVYSPFVMAELCRVKVVILETQLKAIPATPIRALMKKVISVLKLTFKKETIYISPIIKLNSEE